MLDGAFRTWVTLLYQDGEKSSLLGEMEKYGHHILVLAYTVYVYH